MIGLAQFPSPQVRLFRSIWQHACSCCDSLQIAQLVQRFCSPLYNPPHVQAEEQ